MNTRVLVIRLVLLAWACHTFWLSTEAFGSDLTSSFLARVFHLLHINLSGHAFSILHTTVRKLAHICEYAVLSFLVYRSLDGQDRPFWQPHLAGWSIAAAAAYSLTDELHQAFVRGRGASLVDCGIDTIGAAIAMLAVYVRFRVLEARSKENAAL